MSCGLYSLCVKCFSWLTHLCSEACCVCMQQEPLSTANGLCERLLVRAESLRIGVCQAGMQYRHFFAWLLRTVRRLNDDNPQAATEAAAIKVDPTNVAAFLQGQFCRDVIGPEIKVRAYEMKGCCAKQWGHVCDCVAHFCKHRACESFWHRHPKWARLCSTSCHITTIAASSAYQRFSRMCTCLQAGVQT